MPTTALEDLLTEQEAADLCRINICTLRRARRAGEIRVIQRGRLIRYRPRDVQEWLESWTTGGEA